MIGKITETIFVLKAPFMSFESVVLASESVKFVSWSVIITEKILKLWILVIVTDLFLFRT